MLRWDESSLREHAEEEHAHTAHSVAKTALANAGAHSEHGGHANLLQDLLGACSSQPASQTGPPRVVWQFQLAELIDRLAGTPAA